MRVSPSRIAAIGIAQSYCWESPKPTEFGTTGDYWENIGWKVKVAFTPLLHRVRPKDHMDVLGPLRQPSTPRSRPAVTDSRVSTSPRCRRCLPRCWRG